MKIAIPTEVKNHEIVCPGDQGTVGVRAVGHPIHRVTTFAQRTTKTVGNDPIVFGEQNPHAHPL